VSFKEEKIIFDNFEEAILLLGEKDKYFPNLKEAIGCQIIPRGNTLILRGEDKSVEEAKEIISELRKLPKEKKGASIMSQINLIIKDYKDKKRKQNLKAEDTSILSVLPEAIYISERGKPICPKGEKQKEYIRAIRNNDLTISIGPAGTGKTFLAVASAVAALDNKEVNRIILTRPAVEVGEKLGFLPGDMQEKVDPYLRPLYDALYDIIGIEKFHYWFQEGLIEVAPLAFMRGRTLNDSFIILDEAQNTTLEQMKMFLTRLGFDSKAVITGDITQIDLSNPYNSGLVQIQHILKGIPGIKFIYFDGSDVVRHPLVSYIIKAYEDYEKRAK
jgi:phosphate starvation-inducible PhoH-like protein